MKITRIAIAMLMLVGWVGAQAQRHHERPVFNNSRPAELLEFRAYALAGGSAITQNYLKCFPEINELNLSMGLSIGAGVSAQFAIRDFIAIGTELNLLANNYNLDMAVTGNDVSSVSSVFLQNRYYVANFPIYGSLRLNPMRGLKWNFDLGFYYTFGLHGHQSQGFYDAYVNEIGQLVMNIERRKVDYYKGDDAFINSFSRGDIGLHLATGLSFGRHLFLGVRSQIGLKNAVETDGITVPRCNNVNILGQVGWKF